MSENITLIKEVRGLNTYKKVVDTSFTELVTPVQEISAPIVTVSDFFNYYDQLFFDIPATGVTNSHTYLIEKSQQYVGDGIIDQEKQALIEEINSLREQLNDLSSTYLNISQLT
jgi:flagellar capping protein FliD